MAIRIRGGIFSDQTLTGDLTHYRVIGVDFSSTFSDGTYVITNGAGPGIDYVVPFQQPIPNSAAEQIAQLLETKASIGIMNPELEGCGLFFALENGDNAWTSALEIEFAIRGLGSAVGADALDLSTASVEIVPYILSKCTCDDVAGAVAWTELTDTPNAYTGAAGQIVTVNGTEDALIFTSVAGSGLVDSVFGRVGMVVAEPSDYDASQVDNDSTVPGAFVDDALDNLFTNKADKVQPVVTGNLAGLDATGNLTDSGFSPSDFVKYTDSVDALADVDTTSVAPAVGEHLEWDGTNWVPGSASSVGSIDDLTDADTTTTPPTVGQTLSWDGTNWVPTTPSMGATTVSTINGQPMLTLADTTRANKILSIAENTIIYSDNRLGDLDWLQIGNATDAISGYIMDFDGTVTSVTAHCEDTGASSKDIELFIDGVSAGIIATLSGGADVTSQDQTLNIDFTQGQKIRLQAVNGSAGNIEDTVIKLTTKWRGA